MKAVLTVLMVAAFAVTAVAGTNPDIRIYLDIDPPFGIHEVHPEAGTTFDVYVCLDCYGAGGGTRGTAFLLVRTFSGFKVAQTSLMGGLDCGDAEIDPGWTLGRGVYFDPGP